MTIEISRRLFVAGSAAIVTVFASDQRANSQPPPVRMRKNIEALGKAELDAYEHAMSIVKKRSDANPADPGGYLYWANLHNDFDTPHSGCSHFSEKFFPWHRQHLFDFENVLRKTEPAITADVTIPYWDWTKPPKEGAHFPKAFENSSSPLYNVRRNKTPPPWDDTDLKTLIQESDWNVFAGKPDAAEGFGQNPGSIESGPHNTLHSNISRQMADPLSAALDPIFWSFHAYIDVVWTRWQRLFVTDQKPQPFADGAALIWYRDRSFPVSSTAKTSDYHYAYEFDYSIDGPPLAVAVASSILSPAKNIAAMAGVTETARTTSFRPSSRVASTSNSILHLAGIRVFREKTYSIDIYLHPAGIDVFSLNAEARRSFFVRKISLWRAHHDQVVEVFIRLDNAHMKRMNDGWIITLNTEANVGEEELRNILLSSPSPIFALPSTSSLVRGIEIQER